MTKICMAKMQRARRQRAVDLLSAQVGKIKINFIDNNFSFVAGFQG